MSTTVIIAQIFAFVAFILYTLSLQFKKRSKVIKTQIVANAFYALEYLMLNAYAGVNNSLFGISRSILFYILHKKKQKCPAYVMVIFITLIVIFGFISYTDIFSTLPVIISIIFFLAFYSEDMKLFRIVAAIASILWIIYNIAVEAYVGIIDSSVELTSALIAIYRFDIDRQTFRKRLKRRIEKFFKRD